MPEITITKADLARLTPAQLNVMLLAASTIRAVAVVRRKDGTIKYDDPSTAGQYGEELLDGHS